MSRLVVFGDSNTYGEHLEGYGIPSAPDSPSKLAWPNKLQALTQLPVINNARPGLGYKAIWDRINKFPFLHTDTLIVLWPPEHVRVEYIKEDGIDRIRIYYDGLSKTYFKYFFDEHDQMITDLIIRDQVYYTFTSKVKKVISILYKLEQLESIIYKKIIQNYPYLGITALASFDMFELVKKHPNQYAFDNEHHNQFIHNRFAHQVFEHYFK